MTIDESIKAKQMPLVIGGLEYQLRKIQGGYQLTLQEILELDASESIKKTLIRELDKISYSRLVDALTSVVFINEEKINVKPGKD